MKDIETCIPTLLLENAENFARERMNYELSYLSSYLKDYEEDEIQEMTDWVKDHLYKSCLRAYEKGMLDYMSHEKGEEVPLRDVANLNVKGL